MITNERIVLLIQSAIRSKELWDVFTTHITNPWQFNRREFAVLYEVVADLVHRTRTTPTPDSLVIAVQDRLRMAAKLGAPELDEYEWRFLYGIITTRLEHPMDVQEVSYWAGLYIAELTQQDLINSVADTDIDDLSGRLRSYADALDQATAPAQFDDEDFNPMSQKNTDLRTKAINFQPLGISFIDKYLGGIAGREMYSYIAPSGGGKTTVAVQIGATYARLLSQRYRLGLRRIPQGRVFMVTTEDGMAKYTARLLAFLGKIPLGKITGKDVTPMTTAGFTTARDREICTEYFNGTLFGEKERLDMAGKMIAENIRIIDLTKPEIRGVAANMLDVIPTLIDRALDSDKRRGINSYCAYVSVDHAYDCIMDALNQNPKLSLWAATQQTPHKIRDDIAHHYNCPVLVCHQASGQANKKQVGQVISHTDSLGGAGWGTHFNACLNASVLSEETMEAMITCTKARENKRLGATPVKLLGEIGTMVEIEALSEQKKGKKSGKSEKDTWTGSRKLVSRKKEIDMDEVKRECTNPNN